jgi:RNA polymerase sigma-70 factor (ECF subfamily)
MTTLERPDSSSTRPRAVFQSTLWSQVRAAARPEAPDARRALEVLCRIYWEPICAFLRRSGHDPDAAKDLTQGFFAYVLEEELLQKANPERGRFRSFLLGSLKHFVSNQQARERALKRGGGIGFVSIEADLPRLHPADEPATVSSPERLFDQKWALAVLGEALQRLSAEYRRAGQAEEFAELQPHLTGDAEERLPELARRLGKSDGATRVLLCRLRNRYRRLVRAVIADTVGDLDQVEGELRYLGELLRDG